MRSLVLALALAALPVASLLAAAYTEKRDVAAETHLLNDVPAAGAGIINLSCLATLVAIGHTDLTGIVSFIPEKDSAAAIADFLVHNKPAMKKYVAKLGTDVKETSGVTAWDHDVVMRILELYASPLAQTLEPPAPGALKKLSSLSMIPTLTLEEMTGRRRR